VGMTIDLDKVPLREQDMSAYEIMLSESQERMLVVIEKGKEAAAEIICEKWDVPFVQIGEVTGDGIINVTRNGQHVASIPADSLVLGGGAPVYVREQQKPDYLELTRRPVDRGPHFHKEECTSTLYTLLAAPTIASKRWIYEQYDSQVGDNTVMRRDGDAAVLRIKELPGKGVAVTTDCNSRYAYLNPHRGGMIAVAEAARNCVCVGAEPVAITNCLNFGNPYDPEVYWQFAEAIRGMGDMCRALGTPVTGGNVSFHNQSQQHAIFPTPTIGMLGIIDDLDKTVGNAVTAGGENVVLIGWQREELGGSEYLKTVKKRVSGDAPFIDIDEEVRLQRTVLAAIRGGLVTSAHDTAEGGLLVALAEMTLRNGIGMDLDLPYEHNAGNLFGEAQSRVLATVPAGSLDALHQLCADNNVPLTVLGSTGGTSLKIRELLNESVEDLNRAYEDALPTIMSTSLEQV